MNFTITRFSPILILLALTPIAQPSIASAQDIPTPAGMQKELIQDPVFNMNAFEVIIPQKWHFQGTLLQGTKCARAPFPVFRASSSDGLTAFELMPRVDLVYGDNPSIATDKSDCMRINGPMSVKEYLIHLAKTMNVDYVSEEQVPQDILDMQRKALEASRAAMAPKYQAAGMKQPEQTVDLARAILRYKNGSFTMKGQLAATMNCTTVEAHTTPRSPLYSTTTCNVGVRYTRAPEDKYPAAIALLDPHKTGSVQLQPWTQAWIANDDRKTASNINAIQRQGAQNIANIKAQGEQFRASQAVRQREHEEFDATLRQGTQNSIHRTQEAGNARQTADSDMVDYSLDQQTVRDPNTGQITKASSAYSYTWVDTTGKTGYQTNDPNANPNGSLPGTWTRQTVTHGDGTSK